MNLKCAGLAILGVVLLVPWAAADEKADDAPPAKEVAAQIAALDDNEFAVREQATRQLEQWGELVEPALTQALAARPSPEVSRRLEGLLDKVAGLPAGPVLVRALRGVAVLEAAGDAEARKQLKTLADGEKQPRLAAAARAALKRLGDD
jgi:hypothetical protein